MYAKDYNEKDVIDFLVIKGAKLDSDSNATRLDAGHTDVSLWYIVSNNKVFSFQ